LMVLAVLIAGLCIPQDLQMPVQGATKADYNPESFWYYPWGKSVTHKGVDIFASEGTMLKSATWGVVLFSGSISVGGNVVLILGPKLRIHYYAHLEEIKTNSFSIVNKKEIIGSVGSSGNAQGKPAHLHYSIVTIFPYVWRIDSDRQGWKKMFYLNPIAYLDE
jgi:murein DD-endopeptidase MepM/ murein hydrolase activator NlpD